MKWPLRNFIVLALLPAAYAQSRLDTAFQKFWSAASPAEAARTADEIAKSGAAFDDLWQRLKAGRNYTPQKSGVIQLKNRTEDGTEHYYSVNVPEHYDPARRYQLRFQLHGGIGAREDNKPRGNGDIGALAGAEQFYVLPYAWETAPWWGNDQVQNLNAIIDSLKRTYNLDENRVVLSGVSDGATGSYFIAMRDTTPFASFLPLNGYFMVLSNNDIDDGKIFLNNLLNKPLFVVNGGKDRLYPTSIVEPYTRYLMSEGVVIDYHSQPEGEHNTRWWPEIKEPYEKFVTAHPRVPHPDKLTWQAADLTHNRAHWLTIDEFGSVSSEAKDLPDLNNAKRPTGEVERTFFSRPKQPGRVDLVRSGNTVTAATKNVQSFTLLLSPDQFDFNQPVRVVANGKEVFNARVSRDAKTLLKWAAKDNDRTMLYAAEIKIKLPR